MKPLKLKVCLVAGLCWGLAIFTSISLRAQCGCTHIIPLTASLYTIDGNTFKAIDGSTGVKPGDKVCFTSGVRPPFLLQNFHGTAAQPITFTNMCDGKVQITGTPSVGRIVYVGSSSFLHFTGAANPAEQYGIEISIGVQAIDFRDLSTNIEADHMYLHDISYSAFNAKTDPTCNPNTWRGNFTLYDINFHDNWIKNTGGEAVYIGESHYHSYIASTCSGVPTQLYEHTVIGVKVNNNLFENIGRDAIQVGSCIQDCSIHHNIIRGFGATNEYAQQSGIQINPGTNAEVYNNIVDTGTGFAIFAGGRGGSHYYNNIIRNALQGGIICADYEPYDPTGFIFSNNTIVNCNDYGIYMLSEHTNQNLFVNNIIVAPAAQPTFQYVRINNPPVIKWTESNNIKTNNIADLKFVNPATPDFHLLTGSPAINTGKDMTAYSVAFDLDERPRPIGGTFEIGAYEYSPGGPTSNAGLDKSVTLPTNSLNLSGAGTSPTGVTGYLWTQKSGGAATLTNATSPTLSLSGLAQGAYVFELRVTDASGFSLDEVNVTVLPVTTNQNPTANAGVDKTIVLPTTTLTLNGIGTDADGSVSTYTWSKISGPAAVLTNFGTPNLSLSGLVQGTYIFQLTVTDNLLASASDQATVTVNAVATNQLPVVSAGTDKTIYLPTNQVTITGTASDPDGTIATILWEKKSGGAATLSGTNTLSMTANGLVLGTYKFRITVTDDKAGTSFSEMTVNVLQGNQSPVAEAGPNQALTLPTSSATLPGTATDSDGSIASYLWTLVSGPAGSTLTNQTTTSLDVSNLVQGTYVFGFTVTDNSGATGYDQVTVAVNLAPTGPNEVPLAIAGGNVSFSLPTNSVNLYGAGFDPDGTIVSYAWSLASGGAATLANTNNATLTVTALASGQYTFRLIVTDNSGATDEDLATVTVTDLGTNVFPVASAGADKIVRLPLTTVVLTGSGSDEDGQVTTYLWNMVSGPSTATINSSAAATTSIAGLIEGTYVFRLTVTDNTGASDLNDVTVRVVASTSNLPPIVDAGPDIKIFLPQNTLTLNATASDEGSIATYQWSKLGGPAATLTNPTALNLDLADLVQGDYSFQLTVTDDKAASVFDIVKVSVLPASFIPPTVDAGADQTIELPTNQVTLTGAASTATGTIVTTLWTQEVGPAATLAGTGTLNLQATNMPIGTYLFKLTATDSNGKSGSDNVQVVVDPIPPNKPPLVSAGTNQSITASTATLTGTASDADGTVASVSWKLISGPSTPTLANASTLVLTASGLVQGLYVFRLSAVDDDGDTGTDDGLVFVSTGSTSPTNQPPVAYAGADTTLILPQNSITITGEGVDPGGYITDYSWSQLSGATATFVTAQEVLTVTDLSEGVYEFRLTVSDTSLSAFDDVKISVIDSKNEIPKFFSPNNDGYGDKWILRNSQSYQTCGLVVFSRSGQTVYKARPYQNDWDGSYNGKPLSDGDYYYVLNCDDGRVVKGAVRIIR